MTLCGKVLDRTIARLAKLLMKSLKLKHMYCRENKKGEIRRLGLLSWVIRLLRVLLVIELMSL